jgi:nitrogen fixation protein FixH
MSAPNMKETTRRSIMKNIENAPQQPTRKLRLPSWGVRIAIVYSTFALGTLTWAGYAMTRDVDLVRPDYYEYSLEHDKTMRAEENAAALGSGAAITVDAQAVVVQVPNSPAISDGSVTLYRPSSVKQDRTYGLKLDATGMMRIDHAKLPPGQWDVIVQWTAAGKQYKLTRRALF